MNAPSTTESAHEVEIDFRPALDEDIPAVQALLNVYVSQKKIRKVTQIISQLYPQEKLKHMRMFMKLSNKIVSILKIISVNECRTKDTSR